MGDDFFNGMFPYIDLNSGGDVEGYERNVAAAITKIPAGAKIIPGHGALAAIDDLKSFHAMLVETIGLVRQRMKSGKTLEQIQAEGLPEKWNSWGAGFVNTKSWINIVFQSLSKPR
jgi:glyoxylase-like metal-dependent hydrolase (beta-lactamase superfamily II)